MSSVDVPTAEEEAGVRRVFEDYKSAILNQQGDKAANLVSESTLTFFEEVRAAALTAPEQEVRQKRIVQKMMILNLRMRSTAEELHKLDAKGLFSFCVREGMIGSDVRTFDADRAVVQGNEARLGVIAGEKVVPPEMGFRVARERGAWKLDVMSIVGTDDEPLKRAL